MAQHDYIISNQGFPATRADINNVLNSIATLNSGTSAPSTQYAGQMWIDTTTATAWILYIYDGADNIQIATINTSTNTVNFTDSALDVLTDTTPQLGGNLDVNGNSIVSTSNANITLAPDGTGDVVLSADTVKIGDSNANATITTDGTGDLILNTNSGSSSGSITIADGADANITIAPNGTGDILLDADTVRVGDSGANATITSNGAGDLILNTNSGTNSGSITIADGTNGAITLAPNGTGTVTVTGNLSVDGGTIKLDGNYPIGTANVALGDGALDDASLTGGCNVAIGNNALTVNTTGCRNIAIGANALDSNTTGITNIGIGLSALATNTTGGNNVAVGDQALANNTTGCRNVAIGTFSVVDNTTGICNVGIGYEALYCNTTASNNTAVGSGALFLNTTGCQNVAVGSLALDANTTGCFNTVVGFQALTSNTTGTVNTAVGKGALTQNTTGGSHTAIGNNSMQCTTTGLENTAVGDQTLYFNTTGCNNVALGRNALFCTTTGSGNLGLAFATPNGTYAPVFNPITEDNRVVIGHTSVTNAYVKVAWTVTSDCRDKMNIASVPHGLCFVKQLNPVSFNFKTDRNTEVPRGNKRYGFLAQDIIALEGQNPVIIDNEKPEHLKYQGEALVPVLVNAIKELTAKVEALENK